MNRTEANAEGKKIFEKWRRDKEEIERKAKENGTWNTSGLDSNNHLFKELNREAKEKLKLLDSMIDE